MEQAELLIPEWTAKDFETYKPYDHLFQHKDERFLFQQMIRKTAQRAKEVGFSGFTQIFRAYMDDHNPRSTILGVNMTDFPGQKKPLQCGEYSCDERGITKEGRTGEIIEVCPHPVMPVQRIVNIDTNEERLKLAYQRGQEPWREVVVERKTLASAQQIVALANAGIAVNSENARDLVRYITDIESMNYSELPRQDSISHMGWLNDGRFAPFCDGMVYDGASDEFRQMYANCQTPKGSEDVWMDLAKKVRAGNSIPARIALATAFAAPLVKPLNGLTFFTHLWGATSTGKSVALMLAASVWGDPVIGRYAKSFSGTKVSFEMYAGFCGNMPILLDELQVKADRRTFDDIIYMLCEGASKSRGMKEGGLRLQQQWCSAVLTTGEMPITQSNSGGGAMVRTIEVNYGGQMLFDNAREVVKIIQDNYGFAGRKLVQLLQNQEVMKQAKILQQQYSASLSEEIQDKQVLSASILLVADALATKLLFKDNHQLTVEEISQYLVTREMADVNWRCYQWLMSYLPANPKRFELENNSGELWGTIDFDDAGKNPVAYCVIEPIFKRILQNEGYSYDSFISWAKRTGKIKRDSDRNTVKRRIGNGRPRCVCLLLDPEFAKVDDDQDNPFTKETAPVEPGRAPVAAPVGGAQQTLTD